MIILDRNKLDRGFFPFAPVQLYNAANLSLKSFLKINFVTSSVLIPPILQTALN